MTIEELNALYEATDFGNQVNYKAPTTISNTNLTAPVVESIPAIQPYILPPIINQGGDNDGGITTINNRIDSNNPIFRDPFNSILENYIQENEVDPDEFLEKYSDKMFNVQETKSKGIGIQGLIDIYQKFSPITNIMKLGKTGIETAQKYFADKKETERLEALAQEQIRVAEEQKQQAAIAASEAAARGNYTPGGSHLSRGQSGGGLGLSQSQAQSVSQANKDAGYASFGGLKDGGRVRYGKGGIVSL